MTLATWSAGTIAVSEPTSAGIAVVAPLSSAVAAASVSPLAALPRENAESSLSNASALR